MRGVTAAGGGVSIPSLVIGALAVLLTLSGNLRAEPRQPEMRVKAAFVYNFAKFVEWPDEADREEIVVGVVGRDRFRSVLADTIHGKLVRGRPLKVKRLQSLADVAGCQIVFVGGFDERQAGALAELDGAGVLTVSDHPGFSAAGGMIELYLDGSKMRFRINLDAARRAGLRLSSRLLALGQVVGDEE